MAIQQNAPEETAISSRADYKNHDHFTPKPCPRCKGNGYIGDGGYASVDCGNGQTYDEPYGENCPACDGSGRAA